MGGFLGFSEIAADKGNHAKGQDSGPHRLPDTRRTNALLVRFRLPIRLGDGPRHPRHRGVCDIQNPRIRINGMDQLPELLEDAGRKSGGKQRRVWPRVRFQVQHEPFGWHRQRADRVGFLGRYGRISGGVYQSGQRYAWPCLPLSAPVRRYSTGGAGW